MCRGEATEQSPLFYPCLCSGSIKYVHQECLVEWLKHSKKRYCELCKFPFSFSPIYKEQMPRRLPILLVIFGILKYLWRMGKRFLRVLIACIIWIILVPYLSAGWPLRYYLLGNMNISKNSTEGIQKTDSFGSFLSSSQSLPSTISFSSSLANKLIYGFIDCVFGVVLTGLVLLLGLGVLLLRDYMRTHGMLRPPNPPQRREQEQNALINNDPTTIPQNPPLNQNPPPNNSLHFIHDENGNLIPFRNLTIMEEFNSTSNNVATTNITTNTINTPWFTAVSPREYRAYLRRRELFREKQEKENQYQQQRNTARMIRNINDNLLDAEVLINQATLNNVTMNTNLAIGSNGNGNNTFSFLSPITRGNSPNHLEEEKEKEKERVSNRVKLERNIQDYPSPPSNGNNSNSPMGIFSTPSLGKSHSTVTTTRNYQYQHSHDGNHGKEKEKERDKDGENAREGILSADSNSSHPNSLTFGPMTVNGVTFREITIKCHVCDSKTCINRDHVIQASRMRHEQNNQNNQNGIISSNNPLSPLPSSLSFDQNQNNPSANQNQEQGQNISISSNTPTNSFNSATNGLDINNINNRRNILVGNQRRLNNNNNNNNNNQEDQGIGGGWLDADAPNITFGEFLGFSGPWINLFQHSSIVFLCNLLFLHVILFLPESIGRLILAINWKGIIVNNEGGMGGIVTGSGIGVGMGIEEEGIIHYILSFSPIPILFSFISRMGKEYLGMDLWNGLIQIFTCKNFIVSTGINLFIGYLVMVLLGLFEYSIISKLYPNSKFVQLCILLGSSIKFLFILSLEIFAFPFLLGIVWDLCLMKLYGETVYSRLWYHVHSPILSFSIHWIMGVVFMITLASLVQYIRQNIRSGVLYFIRNPHDPEYRPVKDMIEISIWKHLYKILNSLLFYSIFCILFFYSTSIIIRRFIPRLIPLYFGGRSMGLNGNEWNGMKRDHHVELPFEMVINILSSRIMWLIRPTIIITVIKRILKRLLGILRLSSYFLGRGRYLDEESFGPGRGRWAYVPDYDRLYKRERLRDMYKRSVDPSAVARMAIIEGTPKQTTINATTNLLLEEVPHRHYSSSMSLGSNSNNRIHSSMANGTNSNSNSALNTNSAHMNTNSLVVGHANKRQRGVFKGFTIVYIPSNFKLRILILIGAIWILFQLGIIGFVASPTLLGRWIFSHLLSLFSNNKELIGGLNGNVGSSISSVGDGIVSNERTITDLYCFFLGFPILTMMIKAGEIIYTSIKGTDSKLLRMLITHYPCKIIQSISCLFIMFVIWPFTIGLYMLLLLSPWVLSYEKSSILYPVSLWSCGLSAIKFIYITRNYLLSPGRNAIIQEIKNNGWNVSFSRVISNLILPYTLRMFLLILLPPLVVSLIFSPILKLDDGQTIILQRWSFTVTLIVPLIIISIQSLLELKRRLMAGIRDEEYLLGRQLINFEGR